MVRMRKKLSSAVRGIRKQLSTKSSVQVASTQVDAESISPLDSVVAQMNSDVDLEQRRDVDMSTVKEEEEIVDNGIRVRLFTVSFVGSTFEALYSFPFFYTG